MPQTVGLTPNAEVQIIAAYAAPTMAIAAVAATPGWIIVGAMVLGATWPARLSLIGSVSSAALTMRARLFDMHLVEPVEGAGVELTSLTDVRLIGGEVLLRGARVYQIHVEVIGPAGFGSFKTAELV